ncbi:hypothetical protein Tco_0726198 [Tanacetum coccineum]|uniref:Integrase, catalytic region, zinc finger, CCHC-type, peptidase aspartic, catalytic n=1 Tax=Tanacetum coccineum TaxID=301880 RepID=A0ABQ4YHG5_9ASTR
MPRPMGRFVRHYISLFHAMEEVGKENGVSILKSIDEVPFQMGTFRETLAEGNEGALHLGQGNNPRGASAAGNEGAQNRVGNANLGQARQIKCNNYNDKMLLLQASENSVVLDEEQLLFLAGGHDTAVDEDVDESPFQDLALNVDNVFQADECDAFDSDVDEALTAQTMFMVNLSSADLIYDEASPSYDSDILSEDVLEMKAEALKELTPASRPIKALTVYPPNTPATLVPRRITPTGLTEGERDFEQTKEYYLTEVIPFFKTLKEHFEGIQKALTKEIKEMKEIVRELEAEVDQNVMNRKYDEIEQKNLLIANDNLIADCLSKEVFYIATNSELTVSKFTEMHDAHTLVQARCMELEAKLSKLHDKVQKDDHTELVKCFSNLEESVETLREIVEEAKVERPLDRSLASACLYTKHSQELLEYVIGTCPKDFNKRDNKHASTPYN